MWSLEEDFFKPLIDRAVYALWDAAGDNVFLLIARPDDEIVWDGEKFRRKFAWLTVRRKDWKTKQAAMEDIERDIREQVASIDQERGSL